MADRIEAIRRAATAAGADAALLTHPAQLRWAVGFTGSSGALVVGRADVHFVTDGRYDTQAREEVVDAEVHVPGYRIIEHIAENRMFGDAGRIAIAAGRTDVQAFGRMRELLAPAEVVAVDGLLNEQMAVKSEEEIERLRAAQALTVEVLEAVLPMVKAGVKETDIAAELVYQHLKRGAERMSFDPIVASGPRGALPHGDPSDREIQSGEMVVIDVGGVLDGYAADLTRTVAVGDPGQEARHAYDVVRRAQEAGKTAIAGRVACRTADAAARAVIEEAGLGGYFTHSLGHGIGLETHEWPRLSKQADDDIPENAVVTVEPGVYLPGRFGIRIEDVVVARAGGAETLTPMGTELVIL